MPERRYSRYKQEDVWIQLVQMQAHFGCTLIKDTAYGNCVFLIRQLDEGREQQYCAVVLARSSDWYYYSLHCSDRFQHGVTCIVAGTHDSCIDRPVLAMDAGRWYEPGKIRAIFGALEPKQDAHGKLIPDTFERYRKTHYGHNIFIGALMQERKDAIARLELLPESTRLRIMAKLKTLRRRRVGSPLKVYAT